MVANILGIKEEGLGRISIQEADFSIHDKAFEVSWIDKSEKIIDVSRPLIVSVFALVIVFIFLRLLKKYKPEFKATPAKSDYALSALQAMHQKPTPAILNQMIQQKPENVGEALKNWINANEAK